MEDPPPVKRPKLRFIHALTPAEVASGSMALVVTNIAQLQARVGSLSSALPIYTPEENASDSGEPPAS